MILALYQKVDILFSILEELLNSPFNKQFDDKVKRVLSKYGLEVVDGKIVKSQRRVSAEAKENGYGESEDEKVKKVLVELVKCNERCGYFMINNITTSSMLTWLEKQRTSYTKRDVDDAYVEGMAFAKDELEKQGKQILANSAKTCKDEQKPAELHREVEQNLNACLGYIPDEFLRRWLTDIIYVKYGNYSWSKEDEKMLNLIIQDYEAASKSFCGHRGKLDWLKSLKQRIGG